MSEEIDTHVINIEIMIVPASVRVSVNSESTVFSGSFFEHWFGLDVMWIRKKRMESAQWKIPNM